MGIKPFMQLIKDFNFFTCQRIFASCTIQNRQLTKRNSETRVKERSSRIQFLQSNGLEQNYDFKFDLTRALTFDFSAGANAFIYEPVGNPERGTTEWKMNRDTIWDEVLRLWTKTRYNQSIRVNYTSPIIKDSCLTGSLFRLVIRSIHLAGIAALGSGSYCNSIENQNIKQLQWKVDS